MFVTYVGASSAASELRAEFAGSWKIRFISQNDRPRYDTSPHEMIWVKDNFGLKIRQLKFPASQNLRERAIKFITKGRICKQRYAKSALLVNNLTKNR